MARVSLHSLGPCNLLELALLHLVSGQDFTRASGNYTARVLLYFREVFKLGPTETYTVFYSLHGAWYTDRVL